MRTPQHILVDPQRLTVLLLASISCYTTCTSGFTALVGRKAKRSLFSAPSFFASQKNKDFLSKQEQQALWESNESMFEDHQQQQHLTSNRWPRSSHGRKLKQRAARPWLEGVEIRRLEAPHPLAGQWGLFAAHPFEPFDIVGEYTGQVTENAAGGEYATYLERYDARTNKYAMGVDARDGGNECRYINHWEGIGGHPNVVMKRCYIDELPRVVIVCIRNVVVGEELLLEYSKGYVEEYISSTEEGNIA